LAEWGEKDFEHIFGNRNFFSQGKGGRTSSGRNTKVGTVRVRTPQRRKGIKPEKETTRKNYSPRKLTRKDFSLARNGKLRGIPQRKKTEGGEAWVWAWPHYRTGNTRGVNSTQIRHEEGVGLRDILKIRSPGR